MEQPAASPGWRKSSYSNGGGDNCVEVGAWHAADAVLVRDTKNNGEGPVLRVPAETWRTFTTAIRGTLRD
jgi:hypothetical protein